MTLRTPPVVDQSWLRTHGDDVVLADVRWYLDGRSARQAYEAGHLPSAVFVDLERWLAGPPGPRVGRHPLPTPEVFAEGMSRCGIGDEAVVVAYDDDGGVVAARLVWMLRVTGHEAALLDGGLKAWNGSVSTDAVEPRQRVFTPVPWPAELLADIDDAEDPANVVIDARDRARFDGVEEPIDPRAGHIPGARSLPCRENLDGSGRFVPVAVLRERFRAHGVADDVTVVSYCGSGITACHNLLALEHAGFPPGRLYVGSWSQYSNTTRPAETASGCRPRVSDITAGNGASGA